MRIRAIGSNILATVLEKGERTSVGGIVILDDVGKDQGIRPRWCQVYDVGYDSDFWNDIKPGDWILVAQGRWTDGVEVNGETIWKIDPNGVLLCSEEYPDGI